MLRTTSHKDPSRVPALLLLLALGLGARLPPLLFAHGATFDLESYARVAEAVLQGRPLYGNPELVGRYPYLPAWGLMLAGLNFVSILTGLAPNFCYKLPSVAGDLGITVLLFLIMERLTQAPLKPYSGAVWTGRAFWTALAYAVNPLCLLVGAAHGQFDSLALFFLLLAAWYFEFSEDPRSDLWSALCLGASVALKSWPLLLLPFFLKNLNLASERRKFLFFSVLPGLLLLLPFLSGTDGIQVLKAFNYVGSQALSLPAALKACFYGAGASEEGYLAAAGIFKLGALLCFSLIVAVYSLSKFRFPLLPGLALGVLTLYIFAVHLATQYLLWLLPFALLLPGSRLAMKHTLISLVMLLASYALFMPETFLRLETWRLPALAPWFFLVWAAVNLGLWIFFVLQWAQLFRLCRRPKGRLEFT